MPNFNRYAEPVSIEDFSGKIQLREQMMRCKDCGRVTFLNSPCSSCGGTNFVAVYKQAEKQSRAYQLQMWIRTILQQLLMITVLAIAWWPLAILGIGVSAFVMLACYRTSTYFGAEHKSWYWVFHGPIRSKKDAAVQSEDEALLDLVQGYYHDVTYLEKCFAEDTSPDNMENIYCQAERLSVICYHYRLAQLQMQCLIHMVPNEGCFVDIEKICSKMEVRYLKNPTRFLHSLRAWSTFTVLPQGWQVQRVLVDYIERRVTQYLQENSRIYGFEADDATLLRKERLLDRTIWQKAIDMEEKECIARIFRNTIGGVTRTAFSQGTEAQIDQALTSYENLIDLVSEYLTKAEMTLAYEDMSVG